MSGNEAINTVHIPSPEGHDNIKNKFLTHEC
jgi:hypothetical protein